MKACLKHDILKRLKKTKDRKHVMPLRMSKTQWLKLQRVAKRWDKSANALILVAIDTLIANMDSKIEKIAKDTF